MIRKIKRIWKVWKRWRLRYRFLLKWPLLQEEFLAALKKQSSNELQMEWITQPILETDAEHNVPMCLLGVMFVFEEPKAAESATAVFFHDGETWTTAGEVLPNVTPTQAGEILRQRMPQGALPVVK